MDAPFPSPLATPTPAPDLARELDEVVRAWHLPALQAVRRLPGKSNETFLLDHAGGRLVARRSRTDKTLDEMHFELALMRHAHAHGVPTPEVVLTASGEPFAAIDARLWTLTRFVPSEPDDAVEDAPRQAGEVLGRLHAAIASFRSPVPPPRPLHAKDAGPHLARLASATLAPEQAAWRDRATALRAEIAARRRDTLGVIHGGCRRSSLLFRDGRAVALLDFDSAREDDPAMDLAILLWSFAKSRHADHGIDPAAATAVARAFGARHPTDDAFAHALPNCLAEIVLYQGASALRKSACGPVDERADELARAASRIARAEACLHHAPALARRWASAARSGAA